jgi:hypothetical protein
VVVLPTPPFWLAMQKMRVMLASILAEPVRTARRTRH